MTKTLSNFRKVLSLILAFCMVLSVITPISVVVAAPGDYVKLKTFSIDSTGISMTIDTGTSHSASTGIYYVVVPKTWVEDDVGGVPFEGGLDYTNFKDSTWETDVGYRSDTSNVAHGTDIDISSTEKTNTPAANTAYYLILFSGGAANDNDALMHQFTTDSEGEYTYTAPTPLAYTGGSVNLKVGVESDQSIPLATGGTSPYTYTITAGTLPSTLELNESTGAITGTPTKAETITLTVQAKDSATTAATASATVTITVAPGPAAKPEIREDDVTKDTFKGAITDGAKYMVLEADKDAPTAGTGDWKTPTETAVEGKQAVEVTGLTPKTPYKIYAYMPGDDTNTTDSEVVAHEFTTDKEAYNPGLFTIEDVYYKEENWTAEQVAALIKPADETKTYGEISVTKVHKDGEETDLLGNAIDVGAYTVVFKAKGNDDYADTEGLEITWMINMIGGNIQVTDITEDVYANLDKDLAGSAKVIDAVSGADITDKYTIEYVHDSVTGTILNHPSTEEVSIKVTATPKDTTNYSEVSDATLTVTVGSAQEAAPDITAPNTVEYGEEFEVKVDADDKGGSWTVTADEALVELLDGDATDNAEKGVVTLTYRALVASSSVDFTVTQQGNGVDLVQGVQNATTSFKKKQVNLDGITVGEYTYTGKENGPETYTEQTIGGQPYEVTVSYAGTGETNYGPSETAPKDAGTYSVTISLDTNDYYTASSVYETFTIQQAQLKWDGVVVGATKPYDGNSNNAKVSLDSMGGNIISGVNGEEFGVTYKNGQQPTVNYTDGNTDVGNEHTYVITPDMFDFTPYGAAKASNYIMPTNPLTKTNGKITVGTITGITVNAITATYGDEPVTPGYKIADDGPLPAGVTEADISYELVGAADYATMEGGKVKFTKPTPANGNTAQIKLTITNDNYETYTHTADLTIGKKPLSVDPTSASFYATDGSKDLSQTFKIKENLTNLAAAPALSFAIKEGAETSTSISDNKTLSFSTEDEDLDVKITVTLPDNDYYTLAETEVEVDITSAPVLAVDWSNLEKTYDGDPAAVTATADAEANQKDVGDITVQYYVNNAWTTDAPKDAGTYDVQATNGGSGTYSPATNKLTINRAELPLTATATKPYGNGVTMTLAEINDNNAVFSTGIKSESVTLTDIGNAAYTEPDKHDPTTITVTGATFDSGADTDLDNYNITLKITESITAKEIELTATATKPYDGGVTMAVAEINNNNPVFSTGEGAETITLTGVGSAAYSKADVHTDADATVITVTDAVFGDDAGKAANYSVTLKITESISKETITADSITVNAITATYGDEPVTPGYKIANDGDLPAGVTASDISYELVGADNYATMEGGKVKFTKPTPANGNTAQIKLTITNDNYETYTHTADLTIGKKTLSVDPVVASFYVADATKDLSTVFKIKEDLTGLAAAPALSFAIASGAEASTSIGPDNKTLSFSTEDEDLDIKITVTAAGNDYYELAATEVEVDITSAPVLAVVWGNLEKTYNGDPAAVTATADAEANQENVGDITVKYYVNNAWTTDAPKDAGTYDVQATNGGSGTYSPATNKLTISRAELPLTATATKPYGGGTTMAVGEINNNNPVFSTGVKAETVTLIGIGNAAYTEPDKHDPTTITVTGATFDPGADTDLDNYNITLKITESITAKEIALADAKVSKAYDGGDTFGASTVTGNTVNVDGVDVLVTITGGTYDKTTVAATEFTIGGYTLTVGGNATDNYTLTTEKVTGEISPITLNLSVTDLTKGYNGEDDLSESNESAILAALYDAGVIPADQKAEALTLDLSALTYSTENAHTATNLTGAGSLTLSGSAAGNYKLGTVELLGAILAKEVAFDVSKKGFGTSIGTAIDLTDGNSIRVTGGLNGADLIIDDDYTLTWVVKEQGGTGINLTGSQTSAPTAKGTATATVTATLTDSNYTFVDAQGDPVATATVELTITVADGFFTVAFDGNGADGGNMADLENNAVGADVSLTKNAFTKENYVFKGWTLDLEDTENLIEDGATVALTNNDGSALLDKDTVTLYAVWAPTYVLTVNAGEGSDVLTITVDGEPAESGDRFEAGASVVVNVTTKETEGFKFKNWTATGVSLTDATTAQQTFTMTGDVKLDAVITADLTITPQTTINKSTSEVGRLAVANFITSATPMFTGDTVAKLFTAVPAKTEPGIFEGNGVTITFYTDSSYGVMAPINALPTTAGTYYYTVEVEADAEDTPKTNYILQEMPAEPGILTITGTVTPGTTGPGFITPPGFGSGGSSRPTYTVTYTSGLNGVFAVGTNTTEEVYPGETPAEVPNVVANNGYKFLGWSKDGENVVDMAAESITQNTTYTALYAPYNFADADKHLHYMIGRAEGSFVPMGELTRAEAATMLARMTPGFAEGTAYGDAGFTDVAGHWAIDYINFAQAEGIINGYEAEDGSYYFNPDAPVTRGEFSAMIVRFKNIAPVEGASIFGDTAGDWAESYITALVEAGIISGYEDGTFRPGQTINRAEATKIVNGAVGRTPDETVDLEAAGYQNKFSDVSVSDWYFHNVMEATLDHAIVDLH